MELPTVQANEHASLTMGMRFARICLFDGRVSFAELIRRARRRQGLSGEGTSCIGVRR
jgi:hypothetical protein